MSPGKNVRKINGLGKGGATKPLACSVEELRYLIGLSRDAAYKLGRELGRRVGGKRGRWVIPLAAVKEWLRGEASR